MNDSAGPVIIQPVELLHDREFLIRNEGHPFCLRLKILIASVDEWDQLSEYTEPLVTWAANAANLFQSSGQPGRAGPCFNRAADESLRLSR